MHVLCTVQVPPGGTLVVPATFSGRIFDVPPPNAPGPYEGTATVCPHIELLGRPFEKVISLSLLSFFLSLSSPRTPCFSHLQLDLAVWYFSFVLSHPLCLHVSLVLSPFSSFIALSLSLLALFFSLSPSLPLSLPSLPLSPPLPLSLCL